MRSNSKNKTANNKHTDQLRKIMMLKYGLDEGTLYVEQSTLLEPNNFIPSWEAGDEEKKEVSTVLAKLRYKYDIIHKKVNEKNRALKILKKDVDKMQQQEKRVSIDFGGNQNDTEFATLELAHIQEQHQFQILNQRTYQHMLDRMKKDLIALQLQSNDLVESLRSKRGIHNDETNKNMKSREQKLQSKYKLDNLMKNISHERKKQKERIESLQTSIKNKEDALQRRVDRVKRQSDIAEAAANENKDQNEIEKRSKFLVHKVWAQFFKLKMDNVMKQYNQIEVAFQRIRASTGNSDVREMVTKFLTKEQTYAFLLTAVNENEKSLEKLRLETEVKKEKLHQLQIDNDTKKKVNEPQADKKEDIIKEPLPVPQFKNTASTVEETNDERYLLLSDELVQLQSELDYIKGRKKTIQLINNQVNTWTQKVGKKLALQLTQAGETHPLLDENQQPLTEVFGQITEIVNQQLGDIIQNQRQAEAEGNEYFSVGINREFMNDFATDEFVNKNIRVRPVSGMKDVEEKSDHVSKNTNVMFQDQVVNDEVEAKGYADAIHDLNTQRLRQKELKRIQDEKIAAELEKQQKAKQMKK